MKLITLQCIILFSFAAYGVAMNDFLWNLNHDTPPVPPVKSVENMSLQTERVLQNDELRCPICGHLSEIATFNPLSVPFPTENLNFTCAQANSDYILETQQDWFYPKCTGHRRSYENICCERSENSRPYYACQENIHSYLFDSGYNSAVEPHRDFGVDVPVNTLIDYYAVSDLNLFASKVEILMSIVLSWNDPRLAWNVTSENCATSIFVRASQDIEKTSIWVPIVDLFNGENGLQSFSDAQAKVYSDGSVVWNRIGQIRTFCSFVGMRRMPFDHIGCQLIFAESLPQNTYYKLIDIGTNPNHKGVRFKETWKQTYAPYTVIKEKTLSTSYGTRSPSFLVTFYFQRAGRHYISLVLVPTILFVYMSFGQFLYDPGSEERVSFIVSALLIVVAQNIVTSSLLPLCKEAIWLSLVSTACQYFVIIAVFESLLYCYIYKRVVCKAQMKSDQIQDNDENKSNNSDSSVPAINGHRSSTKINNQRLLLIMKKVDKVAMYAFPLAFTLFLIIMAITNTAWDDDPSEIWALR